VPTIGDLTTWPVGSAPFGYRQDRAAEVQPLLRQLVQTAADWVRK